MKLKPTPPNADEAGRNERGPRGVSISYDAKLGRVVLWVPGAAPLWLAPPEAMEIGTALIHAAGVADALSTHMEIFRRAVAEAQAEEAPPPPQESKPN